MPLQFLGQSATRRTPTIIPQVPSAHTPGGMGRLDVLGELLRSQLRLTQTRTERPRRQLTVKRDDDRELLSVKLDVAAALAGREEADADQDLNDAAPLTTGSEGLR
jgi:hypothetical protein